MVSKKSSKQRKHVQVSKNSITVHKTPVTRVAIVILGVAVLLMGAYMTMRAVKLSNNQSRLQEIISIYDSLELDNSYRVARTNIFGDKRVYDWDKGRSFASTVEYGNAKKPSEVRAALKQKVLDAGFTFVQTEYEGSTRPIDEFKNGKGNYVRVATESQYSRNALVYGNPDMNEPLINHSDEAPSYITIKVNLDDNNE